MDARLNQILTAILYLRGLVPMNGSITVEGCTKHRWLRNDGIRHGQVQAADSGNHTAGQERELGDDDGNTGSAHAGLARLLRILPNARPVDTVDWLGSCTSSGGAMAAVENLTPSAGNAASVRRPWPVGGRYRCQRSWSMASRPFASCVFCAFECLFP